MGLRQPLQCRRLSTDGMCAINLLVLPCHGSCFYLSHCSLELHHEKVNCLGRKQKMMHLSFVTMYPALSFGVVLVQQRVAKRPSLWVKPRGLFWGSRCLCRYYKNVWYFSHAMGPVQKRKFKVPYHIVILPRVVGSWLQMTGTLYRIAWPQGYKTFFKLSSAEHEISTANKC